MLRELELVQLIAAGTDPVTGETLDTPDDERLVRARNVYLHALARVRPGAPATDSPAPPPLRPSANWSPEQDAQLRELWSSGYGDLAVLGQLFDRTPAVIATRLVNLQLVPDRLAATRLAKHRPPPPEWAPRPRVDAPVRPWAPTDDIALRLLWLDWQDLPGLAQAFRRSEDATGRRLAKLGLVRGVADARRRPAQPPRSSRVSAVDKQALQCVPDALRSRADSLFAGYVGAVDWLLRPSARLNGQRPLDLLVQLDGPAKVWALLRGT